MPNEVRGFLDHFEIGLLKHNFLAGTLATRLFAGLLRPADDGALAKGVETADQDLAKASSVGDEQCNRGNAPDDAKHREGAACAIAAKSEPGLVKDLQEHQLSGAKAPGFSASLTGGLHRLLKKRVRAVQPLKGHMSLDDLRYR